MAISCIQRRSAVIKPHLLQFLDRSADHIGVDEELNRDGRVELVR